MSEIWQQKKKTIKSSKFASLTRYAGAQTNFYSGAFFFWQGVGW